MAIAAGAVASPGIGTLVLRIYLPFAAAYFLSYLYRTVNSVVGPVIADEMKLSAGDLGFLTSAYFIMFAAVQIPLGVALDRYGPRRVHGTLLAIAAVGAATFGNGSSMTELVIGRALIGLGVAGGLMAAIKAISLWFAPQRWTLMNGIHMAAGGVGSLTATAPTQAALQYTTWHGLFFLLAGITLIVALVIWLAVPEKPDSRASGSLAQQVSVVGRILRSGYFWRIVPLLTFQQCAYIGIQTLWAGPWLRDIAGMNATDRADVLFLTAAAMTVGFFTTGMVAGVMRRFGYGDFHAAAGAAVIFCAVMSVITFVQPANVILWWMLFGYFGAYGIVFFPPLAQAFTPELAGRVTTTANFVTFATIFLGQWGIGRIVDLWPRTANGYAPEGYTWAFALLIALQIVTLIWLVLFRARPPVESAARTPP
jgi:MFS family permease